MKKQFVLLLIVFALTIASGCSQDAQEASPVFATTEDSYDATAQEIIDFLNKGMDEDMYLIPDFEESYAAIEINGSQLTITFREDAGTVKQIRLYWYGGGSPENIKTAGYITSCLISALCTDQVDQALEAVNDAVGNATDITYTAGSTLIEYAEFGSGGNTVEFSPIAPEQ